MSKGPKKQHFVPKFYLTEFVDPDTPPGQQPYVWVFGRDSKVGRKKAPSNIFTEKNLYTIRLKSGQREFIIEQTLSHIESRFANVLRNKIKNKQPLSDEDHVYLCIFVAAQFQRTLSYKRNQESFLQQIIDLGKQVSMAHGVESEQVKKWEEYQKDMHKVQLVDGVSFLANIMSQMSIAFLCTRNPSRHWFISSDDPCVLFNPDLQWQRFYGPGFGQKNVQVTMALSPEVVVMFSWANFHGYSYLTDGQVEDINRMTRAHSDKEFISPRPYPKWIWYSNIPVDPIFFLKWLKKRTLWLTSDLKNRWQYRKIYARNKK